MQVRVDDFAELAIDVEVHDLTHLTRIIKELGKKPVITKVERLLG